jgi:hypothetical protein
MQDRRLGMPGRFALFTVLVAGLLMGRKALAQNADVRFTTRTVPIGGRSFQCRVVTLDLTAGKLIPRVVTARDGVGRTEAFDSMVKRTHAVAAINGSFFDAYNQVGDKDPGMTLICGGTIIHKGGIGTVVGFGPKCVVMGRLDLPIRGTVTVPGRRTSPWYAYWINRTPMSADNIAIFTPARGVRTRVSDGMSVVVENNVVTRVVPGDTTIPTRGYVIHFRGNESGEVAKFPVGATVSVKIAIVPDGHVKEWTEVTEAVGAGPRLVTDGKVTLNAGAEGFGDAKILTNQGQRSALGVTADGHVLLVTVGGPTVAELAQVMQKLGAVQAMNLDGGASSGLSCNGSLLTSPARLLSNALVFVRP